MRVTAILCLILLWTVSTSAKKDKKKKKPAEKSNPPQEQSVWQRDLVKEKIKGSQIMKEFMSYSTELRTKKQTEENVLGYVTPWNNHGYDVAKIFGNKFTMISPTWLTCQPGPDGGVKINGLHDKDEGWMADVRKTRGIKLLPRLIFDKWSPEDLKKLFSREENLEKAASEIVEVCQKHNFDGVVLEFWLQLYPQRRKLSHLTAHLGDRLRESELISVLVLPPPVGKGMKPMITKEEFDDVIDIVDYVSLMTYDFSGPSHPGPIAPIKWMKENVEYLVPDGESLSLRKKILLGFNMYGLMSTGGKGESIHHGAHYMELIDNNTPKFSWNKEYAEHEGTFTHKYNGDVYRLWYPTLMSLQKRIQLSKDLGVGIAIWEIGQGLDYFYDLL